MTPWDAVEKSRDHATKIGSFTIGKLEYTTLQGEAFSGLWLENSEGEGMSVPTDKIPEGADEQFLQKFWKENF